jgi:hypothetical protein
MAFSIIYLRRSKWVWDTNWTAAIPPSCNYVRHSLQVHEADTAIVTHENGHHVIIEERQRFDA